MENEIRTMQQEEPIFITDLTIKKIRHLENIHIPLSKTERKNLIITGKNGSGKTSFLDALKRFLGGTQYFGFEYGEDWVLSASESVRKAYERDSSSPPIKMRLKDSLLMEPGRSSHLRTVELMDLNFNQAKTPYHFFNKEYHYSSFSIEPEKFLFSSFNAYRQAKFKAVEGPKVITEGNPDESNFIQQLINLRYERLEANDSGQNDKAVAIENWFLKFEKNLKELFEDENLKLDYEHKFYNFNIHQTGKLPFNFNQLSSGYAAVLKIVTELMVKMTRQKLTTDIQGVVLIDEIEVHLHIELQKKILPFLTSLFPNIQFIVTTHSPFVLMSDSNSIVFDLETKQLVEDMTKFSLDAIIETYFDSDKYSDSIKRKVAEYEELVKRIEELTEKEEEKLIDLRRELKDTPKTLAPELSLKLNQLEAAGVL